jgi:hypothetical protein
VQDTEKIGQLSEKKYTERVSALKYSITFAGSAVAFIITAKTKLNIDIPTNDLKFTETGHYIIGCPDSA